MANKTYLEQSRYPLLRLLSYMQGERKQYLLAMLYSALNKLFDIFPEVLIGGAVAVVVNRKDSWLARLTGIHHLFLQLTILGILTFIAWSLESWFQYLYSLKWRNLAQIVENKLRIETYQHIQSASVHQIDSTPTGQLVSTMNDDINQLERFLEDGINQLVQIFTSTLLLAIIFLLCSPFITLFAVLPIPFILIGAFYFQNRLAPRFLNVREKAANISAALANNLQSILSIKSYTAEKQECQHIKALSDDYQKANQSTIRISSMVTPILRIVILMGFLCTLMIGGYETLYKGMNVGVFSLLIFLSQRLLWPFSNLAEVTVNFQRVMASTKRVLDLLTWPKEVKTIRDKTKIIPFEYHDILFDNVSFHYPNSRLTVFNDLNLTIEAKKVIAFVGETGSGKSTLIKLLNCFYTPTHGAIRYGKNTLEQFDRQWWRQQISLVSQDVYLFSGSIRDNIAYGRPDVSEASLLQATHDAGLFSFIESLPDGLETQVGERGLSLSGGQRQRIAIARAIVKDAPIFILDEATSAVDNETERVIQQALEKITQGKTTIIIAHRLSTTRHANQIYVMDKGNIIESGTHEALLEKNGRYANLWRIQTGESKPVKKPPS